MISLRLRLSCVATALIVTVNAFAQTRAASTFDRYGYRTFDSATAQCSYGYVDASGGTALGLSPASGAPANDDGAALVSLAAPFQFYGSNASSLIASSNGYLAAAADLTAEDGGDFSADCPLPAIADNALATQARIYVYHADLDGGSNGGSMYTRFYADCPRASESGVAEACTVVQWQNWALRNQSGTLSMEAVLYHASYEIALQFAGLDGSFGSTATVGIQSKNATSANAYGCGGSHPLQPAMAVCFFDPRYPPGSHAAIDRIFSDGFESP
jgi:hypothetical protein